jgi:integrase
MTRYPRSGRGRRWTVVELKAIGSDWRGDTLADGDGLTGTVRLAENDSVTIHWRYAYKRDGRVAWHYCGIWPTLSLEKVRAARDEARDSLKQGVDPKLKREADRIDERKRLQAVIDAETQRRAEEATIGEMVQLWLKTGVLRKDGNAELRRAFDKGVLPFIGDKPVRATTEEDLRQVLIAFVDRGANRSAVTLLHALRQVFRWAEKRQPWRRLLLEGNPAELVRIETIVTPDYDLSNVRSRVLSADEVRDLRDIFASMEADYRSAADRRSTVRPVLRETQHALWICLSTSCRIGELLQSQWSHLDLEANTWSIPKENTKGARGKQQEQRVFLSDFALGQFRALQAITGQTQWCFPSRDGLSHVDLKTVSKQVGDRQHRFKNRKTLARRSNDDSLVLAGGRKGEWTPHDLRRTAATMMQALGVSPDVIDRCQNHVLAGSKVRRHYLTHEYDDEKRQAWNVLGAEIEAILKATSTTSTASAKSPVSTLRAAESPVATPPEGRASKGTASASVNAPRRSVAR